MALPLRITSTDVEFPHNHLENGKTLWRAVRLSIPASGLVYRVWRFMAMRTWCGHQTIFLVVLRISTLINQRWNAEYTSTCDPAAPPVGRVTRLVCHKTLIYRPDGWKGFHATRFIFTCPPPPPCSRSPSRRQSRPNTFGTVSATQVDDAWYPPGFSSRSVATSNSSGPVGNRNLLGWIFSSPLQTLFSFHIIRQLIFREISLLS